MPAIQFCKFHGFGNDYIVIERDAIPNNNSVTELAKDICHRHTGAGADGIAVIGPDEEADFFCEIVNPDGSVAGFSGNGTRCAVAYLYYKKLWDKPSLTLRTRSGVKHYELLEADETGGYVFRAEIGEPKFATGDVPFDPRSTGMAGETKTPVATDPITDVIIEQPIATNNGSLFEVSCVNVGNPVACIFVDKFDENWREIGQQLEVHSAFPERANIVFVKILDRENIEIRIWERGAGETSASGTCSAGSAVLSAFTARTDRHVRVRSPGGVTDVVWRDDDEMLLTGRAELSYCGEWPHKNGKRKTENGK